MSIKSEVNKILAMTMDYLNNAAPKSNDRFNISRYGGCAAGFQPFVREFNAKVHQNEHFSKSDKLRWFKSYTFGAAKVFLNKFSDYDEAWEKFQLRFGNKNLLVRNAVNRILGHKAPRKKPKEKVEDVKKALQQLKAAGIKAEGDLAEVFLIYLKQDMPGSLVTKWEEKGQGFTDFIAFMEANLKLQGFKANRKRPHQEQQQHEQQQQGAKKRKQRSIRGAKNQGFLNCNRKQSQGQYTNFGLFSAEK